VGHFLGVRVVNLEENYDDGNGLILQAGAKIPALRVKW
jgi:hypothetical protein